MIDPAWKTWYRAQHESRCLQPGAGFESYATAVLSRLHPDFLNPDPMGSLGDGGCDGLAENGTILYACYGQNATTAVDQKTKNKLDSDFSRAITNWPNFTTWRFVTNAAVGPTPTKRLLELQNEHAPGSQRPLTIELWKAPEEFWWKAVSKLTPAQLDELIPGVPHAQDVELRDLIELINSLTFPDAEAIDRIEPIKPVPASKMDFNGLPMMTREEFNEGRLLAPRIDRWFAEQNDPGLRDAKAQRFNAIYREARNTTSDVREIMRLIYGALGGQDFDLSTKRANAVYAVTSYFFDSCDIFEEPPEEEIGGDQQDVASN